MEGRSEPGGQRTLWKRYSFADLPVELISHVYQLFVEDTDVAVYTPRFLVRFMLGEILNLERLDRLEEEDEVILDPACGSGVFLVEAYKRLVLHWRYRNGWEPPSPEVLKGLLTRRLLGVDKDKGAVELAAFSLCLALCDALEPMEIRASVKLFPPLVGKVIHLGCFFEACEQGKVAKRVGVVTGNPPFASKLSTDGAQRAYDRYQQEHGPLPDKQLAYLFLHECMETLASGGVLSMLQPYGFLYNERSRAFRREFIESWDVREILDFISVGGLFRKAKVNTRVVAIVAEGQEPPPDRRILHATFRRSGRADAEQGFDIDYYDLHWLPRDLVVSNDRVWRSDLLGGGRVLGLVDRLAKLRTLAEYVDEQGWDCGEGYTKGSGDASASSSHIAGMPMLPAEAITSSGIDHSAITTAPDGPIERPRSKERFSPPILLVRERMDIPFGLWTAGYLTYGHQVLGISAGVGDLGRLERVAEWFCCYHDVLQAYIAAISIRLFAQKATSISPLDIKSLPYPQSASLNLSPHEQIVVADIVDYYCDLIRLGERSPALVESGERVLSQFNDVFVARINGVYGERKLHACEAHIWPGMICQPYVFGKGRVDWSGAHELKGRLDRLLQERHDGGLNVTRIARLYDSGCIYLLKPDRLRYWLRSIALRDADETLADLAEQGF